MTDLREGTATRLLMELVVANPPLPREYFSQRQLTSPRLRVPDGFVGAVRSF